MTQNDLKTSPKEESANPLLPVPYHPLVILTPATNQPPSLLATQILTGQCRTLIANGKTYTITASPVNCAPSKNDFFSLSPNWWQKADGTWEHRDGIRNPIADAAACQNELERMAMTIHTLAQGHKHLQSSDPTLAQACLKRADETLKVFFLDEDTRMKPEVKYSQCIPNVDSLMGNANFVIATRYLILVAQAMCMLPTVFTSRQGVEAWFRAHVEWMTSSPQCQEAKVLENKMSRWYHASFASYLQISNSGESMKHATKTIYELMAEHPQPGDTLFVKELSRSRPRHNTIWALEPFFILASLTIPGHSAPMLDDIHTNAGPDRASLSAPSEDILLWLEKVVCIAVRTQPGAIEVNIDSDERLEIKLWFFLRQIRRWRAKSVEDVEVDGTPWEGGWRHWSKLAWIMI